MNRLTSAVQGGQTLAFAHDALGRNTGQSGPLGTVGYQYDTAGRRTRMTWPDGFYVTYEYHTDGSIKAIRENGSTVLASYGYNTQGEPTGVTFANGASQSLAFDPVGRLSSIAANLAGTSADNTRGFTYNPAGQLMQTTQSNDAYAFDGLYNVDRTYTVNGRNQLTSAGGVTLSYDTRGNLTNSGTDTFAYTSENLLTGVTGAASLAYDPLGRLWQVDDLTSGGPTTRFGYDGIAMIGEYNTSNQLLRRYVHGPGIDSPIVWYEGSGTTNRRFLHADERGSIIAVSNASGALLGANAYDEYGIPADDNLGRFQYTGQVWLEEAGLYYYKARMYSPTLGRFLQTDPIGYADGMNLYNYVGSDPANFVDSLGLCKSGVEWVWNSETKQWDHHVVVCADTGRGGGSGGKDNGGEGIIPPSGPAPSPSPEDGFGGGRLPQNTHRYNISVVTQCSADSAFGAVRGAGNSAPGAPFARSGTHDLTLAPLGDPITQTVDPRSRTITNVTGPDHRFHPGRVEIRVNDLGGGYSSINITGTGSGDNPTFNNLVGALIFGGMAHAVANYCAAKNGTPNLKR
ncbi:RHS repeat-associated core domain-containing protein [Pelagerythrobacter marensis]|uniref:RHS repeat-associated core domain-containing protein n=1 Tax=Pelagerythrobacter marensis TaxID=543877 RepID=A0ABZ2D209_9SPHN